MSQPATEASAQVLQSPQSNSSVTLYYDNKYWENNSCYGRYEQKLYYMEQIQNYFKDNGSSVKGFSSVFSQMFSDLDTLRSKPSDKTVRNQLSAVHRVFVRISTR